MFTFVVNRGIAFVLFTNANDHLPERVVSKGKAEIDSIWSFRGLPTTS